MPVPPNPSPLAALRTALQSVILGQEAAIDLLLVALLSAGHALVEDVPGVGKTTLAKALAKALDVSFARVQCTPDILPSDILGANVLDPSDGSMTFREGPVFTQILLVDETNRASPRTQSGLLEAMNERQVTVDGVTRALPSPFFVVATQNPVDFQGTFPLPTAQLDRFLVRVRMGYPAEAEELSVLLDRQSIDPLDRVTPVLDGAGVLALQADVRAVHVDEAVSRYLLQLCRRTRGLPDLSLGVSTRGALALFRAAQARALLAGRTWVGPSDVQALVEPVLAHRVVVSPSALYSGREARVVLEGVVASVPVPV